jgi:hypothetical protein
VSRWGELAEVRARRANLAMRIKCLKPRSFKRRALEALALELTSQELLLAQTPPLVLLLGPPAAEPLPVAAEPCADEAPAQGDLYGGRAPWWIER